MKSERTASGRTGIGARHRRVLKNRVLWLEEQIASMSADLRPGVRARLLNYREQIDAIEWALEQLEVASEQREHNLRLLAEIERRDLASGAVVPRLVKKA